MNTIREFKYKLIKGFFSSDELSLLKLHAQKMIKRPWLTDTGKITSNITPKWTNVDDHFVNILLEHKRAKMEELTGLELLKTYAYWRYYHFGSFLDPHKDIESCEISVTACIHKTDNWPIVMDGKEIEMEEGDGVIYLGCELQHGRTEKFKGDGMAQIFMHYVDKNGPYVEHENDRPRLICRYGEIAAESILSEL